MEVFRNLLASTSSWRLLTKTAVKINVECSGFSLSLMFQALILHFFPLITFFFPHGFLGHIIPRHMTRERAGHAVRSNHILDRSQAPISLSASLMRSTYVDCYDRLPVFPGLFLFLPRSAHKYRTCSRMERRMQIYPQESLNVFSPRFCLRPV